jgi:precorrin-6Y C5,15-methyltransferase (decarboxylating) CbiT subunit
MPGIADADFIRGKVPMTKREIRVQALSMAKIQSDDVIFDIGAGTGSLSIESALLAKTGQVFAFEREPDALELIHQNALRFGVENITICPGEAPASLAGRQPPDVVLIGGSGGQLYPILRCCHDLLKPGGRMVITAVTLETAYHTLEWLKQAASYQTEAICLQVTRLKQIQSFHMFDALNPIILIGAYKEDERQE